MARRDPDAGPAEGQRRAQRAHHVLPSARLAGVLCLRGDCPGQEPVRVERGESRSLSLSLLTACCLDRFQVNGTIPIQLTRLLIANPCASLSASPGERHFPVLHPTKQHRSPCRRSGACRHVNDPQRSVQPLPTRCPVAGPLCRCAVGRAAPAAATDSHDTVGRRFHSIVGCLPPPPPAPLLD